MFSKKTITSLLQICTILWSSLNAYEFNYDACEPKNCNSFYVCAEGLIFKVCEEGLAYGTELERIPFLETKQTVKSVHPRWDSGFRIGVGWKRGDNCIDFAAAWMHFHTKACTCRSFTQTPDHFIIGEYIQGLPVDHVKAHWKLKLDFLDINIEKRFALCNCLNLRPYIGVRAGWISQKYNIFYSTPSIMTRELVTGFVPFFVDVHHDFEGAGLNGGFEATWELCYGFSLYGQTGCSLLWGSYNSKTDIFVPPVPILGSSDTQIKANNWDSQAILDLAAGFQWTTPFYCESRILTIYAGWEQHLLFNFNKFMPRTDLTSRTGSRKFLKDCDLCLNGFVIGAQLDF